MVTIMDFKHELVLPNEDLPFRMFIFEGKDGNYKVAKHWHRSVEIFFVLEGNIDFYINSELITLGKNQFILVNSNEVHSIDCPNPNFTIVLQIPVELFEKYLGKRDCFMFWRTCPEKDAALAALIRHMYEVYASMQYGYLLNSLGDFYYLLNLLVTSYQIPVVDADLRKQNKNLERLSEITDYIQANYRENLSLEGVAGVFGYSPAYLSRMFQKYAGINYKSYLLELRTSAGYRLLMNTTQPVGEIATACGFPDSRSFAKSFCKRYGMSPAEYRKKSLRLS